MNKAEKIVIDTPKYGTGDLRQAVQRLIREDRSSLNQYQQEHLKTLEKAEKAK